MCACDVSGALTITVLGPGTVWARTTMPGDPDLLAVRNQCKMLFDVFEITERQSAL